MKTKNIIFLFIFIFLTSCGIWSKLKSIVKNKFPSVKELKLHNFEAWNNSNLYILRVELQIESTLDYEKDSDSTGRISDYPFKNYILMTVPDWSNNNIVEEVYLYLSNFDSSDSSGSVLYMSSIPLSSEASELMFCNKKFISTYAINHVMTGKWFRENKKIKVDIYDNKNKLHLEGRCLDLKLNDSTCSQTIEFTDVNHPKLLKDNDDSYIKIKDVFNVNPNNIGDDVNGIRFFQSERIFMHHNWDVLGNKFNYYNTSRYYFENIENRKITKVMIDNNSKRRVYFEINDPYLQLPKNNIIGYHK